MDGYSVTEAATVLGVPEPRVWELIARGVLSGAPEGDGGMRVFLQPRPGRHSPVSATHEEPPRTNGNGGHAEVSGEGSPFREILTEFRSLTERYGQALLALGEARGEVAGLRSRVELLEARLDLRLPGPRASSTVAWEMPDNTPPAPVAPETAAHEPAAPVPPAPVAAAPVSAAPVPATPEPAASEARFETAAPEAAAPEAAAPDATEPEATAPEPTEPDEPDAEETAGLADVAELAEPRVVEPAPRIPSTEEQRSERGASRRRRVLRSHSAIAGIAEAIARAQDPTLADLPGGREAAEALAALQREVDARRATLEPAAEPELVNVAQAETVAEPATEPLAEPDRSAGDEFVAVSGPEAAPEAGTQPEEAEASFVEPAAATRAQDLVEEEPSIDERRVEPILEEVAKEIGELEAEQIHEVGTEREPEPMLEVATELEPEPMVEAATELAPEPMLQAERETEAEPEPEQAASAPEEPEPAAATATESSSPYTTEVVEPDWFADGDFTWLEAAQAEATEQAARDASEEVDGEPAAELESTREAEEQARDQAREEATAPAEAIQDALEVAEPATSETQAATGFAATLETEAAAAPKTTPEAGPEPAVGAEAEEHKRSLDEAASAAEAIQDAFEAAEPEAAPEAVAEPAAAPEAVAEQVAELEAAREPALVVEAEEHKRSLDEAAPAAEAIQDAFEAAEPEAVPEGVAEPEPVPEALAEPQVVPEPAPVVEAEEHVPTQELPYPAWEPIQDAFEASAPEAVAEPQAAVEDEHGRTHEEAAPAAEAIQDAYGPSMLEPTEATAELLPSATATRSEAPFTPDVAVFAVDKPQAEAAESAPDWEVDAGAQEALPELTTPQPPTTLPPMTEGLGWPAVHATTPPIVQPSAQVRAQPEEEELMWLGDEFEAAGLEIATTGWHGEREASVEPVRDTPTHEMSDADLAQLAEDEGWDVDEVDAIRTLLGRAVPAQPTAELVEPTETEPSVDLAVDAPSPPDDIHPMEEAAAAPEPAEAASDVEPMPSTAWIWPEPVVPEPIAAEAVVEGPTVQATTVEVPDAVSFGTDTLADSPPPALSVEETIRLSLAARMEQGPGAPEPDWLRQRRGPAARAYRRLRRLLPS